ncbi:MAG: DMT family transporter [Fimbriimonadaceae bacterium]|nr:DMT family transporter [Fimbriimonadaceae bacterium]
MRERPATLLLLLLAAGLFGAVSLFGRLTELTPGAVAFGRSVAAAVILVALARGIRLPPDLGRGNLVRLLVAGACQAGNWALFFAAIQTAGIAVAVLALFTYPIFTALAEPLVTKSGWRRVELIGGGLVLAGMFFVMGAPTLADSTTLGVVYGVLSSLFLTVRNVLGKVLVGKMDAVNLNLWFCLACIPICLPMRLADPTPVAFQEIWQAAALGILFTAAPQIIFFHSLKEVTASAASLVVSMQPIFAILFGWLLFREAPTQGVWIGGSLILAAVLLVGLSPAPRPEPTAQESGEPDRVST